jgi:hypothetical protein
MGHPTLQAVCLSCVGAQRCQRCLTLPAPPPQGGPKQELLNWASINQSIYVTSVAMLSKKVHPHLTVYLHLCLYPTKQHATYKGSLPHRRPMAPDTAGRGAPQ